LLFYLTHFCRLKLAHLQSDHLPNCVPHTYLCHPLLMVDICTSTVISLQILILSCVDTGGLHFVGGVRGQNTDRNCRFFPEVSQV
jgi:hypothetical protein